MTAKEYLLRAWKIDERIDAKIEERERLVSRITSPRMARLTGMPRGGGSDWTNAVIAVSDLSAEITAEIIELCRIKREVNEAIEAVDGANCRRVLELRYRNYMSWEAIAKAMGYDVRNVYIIHGKALLKVRVPKDVI